MNAKNAGKFIIRVLKKGNKLIVAELFNFRNHMKNNVKTRKV